MEELLVLREDDFTGKADMLEYIAEVLDFPEYFGNNLDALFDCLCDIGDPANITFDPFPGEDSEEWYQRIAETIFDAAENNDNIKVFRPVE